MQAFSTCSKPGLLFIAVLRLLTAMASLVSDTGSRRMGFRNCCLWVVVHGLSCSSARGILVPQPGIKPMTLALTGRFLTIRSPVKSYNKVFSKIMNKSNSIYRAFFLTAKLRCVHFPKMTPTVSPTLLFPNVTKIWSLCPFSLE